MTEEEIIRRCLAPIAGEGARGLLDDCAVIAPPPGRELVLTKDMIAADVHFLSDDPPEAIAHKLIAVNLSDLAAKGAVPLGCLLGLGLPAGISDSWIEAFAHGLGAATQHYACPLLGGDTIRGVDRLTLSLTALGSVLPGTALDRRGARAGDSLYVSGSIGDAGLALRLLKAGQMPAPEQLARYQKPKPRLAMGQGLIGLASACCDVSDGLLLDARRLAQASGLSVTLNAELVPLSRSYLATGADRRFALSAGDDYELLFTAAADHEAALLTLSQRVGLTVTRIGQCHPAGPDPLQLVWRDGRREIPEVLGYLH